MSKLGRGIFGGCVEACTTHSPGTPHENKLISMPRIGRATSSPVQPHIQNLPSSGRGRASIRSSQRWASPALQAPGILWDSLLMPVSAEAQDAQNVLYHGRFIKQNSPLMLRKQDLASRPSMAATHPDHQVLQSIIKLHYTVLYSGDDCPVSVPYCETWRHRLPQSRGEQALRRKVPRRVNPYLPDTIRRIRTIAKERTLKFLDPYHQVATIITRATLELFQGTLVRSRKCRRIADLARQ